MVRGPPVTSYDDTYLSSSDTNLHRQQSVRERVGNIFNVPSSRVRLTEDTPLSDSETDHIDRRYREIMQKHQ